MTDESSQPTAEQDREAAVQPDAAPIIIDVQYIKDFSFENPNAPVVFTELQGAPEIDVNVNVAVQNLAEATFEVILVLHAHAKYGDKTAFLAELVYGCVTRLAGIPENSIEPVLLIEVPRLIFPFARAILADATRGGGYPPLLINPVDFAGMYRTRKEAQAAQGEQADANAPASDTTH
ncbi:MAG: protein-export chaperone SecB [Alphaproteobacteria bacterium]